MNKQFKIQNFKIEGSADIAFQRSKVYRLFSYLFSYPDRELFEFMKEGGFSLEIENALRMIDALDRNICRQIRKAEKQCSVTVFEAVKDEYSRLFETPAERPVLYEASFRDFPEEEMADIAGFYTAFGFGFKERPDHIAAELEFLHVLTLMEARAAMGSDKEKVDLCADTQRKFLTAHTGKWIKAMAENIKNRGGTFYHSFAQALNLWIDVEAWYLGIEIKPVKSMAALCIKEDAVICPALNKY